MTNIDNEYEEEKNNKKQKGIKGFFAGLHDSYIPTSEDSLKRITKVIVLLCIVVFIVSSVSIVSYYYKHKSKRI